ncbi:uncharacterized protein LOC116181664 isoform X2 [Photinus pyralis]|uniref:uncharacterized protein LOC116181664 isoform X2 n=1 Tax=Photinus pyralis TaxID=7054 RepID=UPI001267204C|nr:uncharacterized protein LOC116181664 isoform X2 [Photinus pyralis]
MAVTANIETISDWGDTEDTFINSIEQKLEVQIPLFLKNIVKVSGLANKIGIKNLSEDDINRLEEFVKGELVDLIDKEEYENYYGPLFKKKPTNFKFLMGHRKLLLAMSESQRELTTTTSQQQNKRKVKPSREPSIASTCNNTNLQMAENLSKYSTKIKQNIVSWVLLLKKESKITEDEEREYTTKIKSIEYQCSPDDDDFICCYIPCFICDAKVKDNSKPKSKRTIRQPTLHTFCSEPSTSSSFIPTISRVDEKIGEDAQETRSDVEVVVSAVLSSEEEDEDIIQPRKKANKQIILSDIESGTEQDFPRDFQTDGIVHEGAYSSVEQSLHQPQQQPTSVLVENKWLSPKYSRCERNRRGRENSFDDEKQLLITNFYKPLKDIEKVLIENSQLKEIIQEQAKKFRLLGDKVGGASLTGAPVSIFLNIMLDTAAANASKTKSKNRFDESVKKFCLYLFLIGGRMLYETLYANLKNVIPSITTLHRSITNSNIQEGELRFADLRRFLDSRGLPSVVWISEDATKITGKIGYSSHNNLVVGFVIPQHNGLPRENYFEATSARRIQQIFVEGERAQYGYAIMAQCPIDKTPSFCLNIFGTNNKFTHNDVIQRWEQMKVSARRYNIELLGFSSDGDTRLLKAMRLTTKLSNQVTEKWKWFHMPLDTGNICTQDTVHIGTKLKTRLINQKVTLALGNFIASSDHLKTLIETVSKDKHLLTLGDLNSQDKMNFRSVEKIIAPKVSELLKKSVPNSEGTVAYLKILRSVLDAFLRKDLSPVRRLQLIWYAVFFLRIWRSWVRNSESYTVTENFITLNAYLCIEMNAHALIKIIRKFREEKLDTDFATWLFSSQPCEQIFRATRSLTSTYSTIVNFSLMEMLNRINKIETIVSIMSDLRDTFVFPREGSSRMGTAHNSIGIVFPCDEEIESVCMTALQEAINDCKLLGIYNDRDNDDTQNLWEQIMIFDGSIDSQPYKLQDPDALDYHCVDLNLSEEFSYEPATNDVLRQFVDQQDDSETSEDQEQDDDHSDSLINFQDLNFADVPVEEPIHERSPYVKIKCQNGQIKTIRKKTLCWFLDDNVKRLSSDRLLRVRADQNYNSRSPRTESTSETHPLKPVLESYYAVYYSESWYIGRVITQSEDKCYKIKFLQSQLNTFIWPKDDDVQTVDQQYIFFGPIKMIGTNNMTISEENRNAIKRKYKSIKKMYK